MQEATRLDEAALSARLEQEIQQYVRRGYRVLSRTDRSAQLMKPKSFSFLLALILGIFMLAPLIIYLIWYLAKKDHLVYLTIDATGKIHRQG